MHEATPSILQACGGRLCTITAGTAYIAHLPAGLFALTWSPLRGIPPESGSQKRGTDNATQKSETGPSQVESETPGTSAQHPSNPPPTSSLASPGPQGRTRTRVSEPPKAPAADLLEAADRKLESLGNPETSFYSTLKGWPGQLAPRSSSMRTWKSLCPARKRPLFFWGLLGFVINAFTGASKGALARA